METLYGFELKTIDGETLPLSTYRGKVLLIVNVASKCGFTPQYRGLELLYQKYKERGFVILGIPSNQFAGQEPGSDAQIKAFCSLTYAVSFPMFSKVEVNGKKCVPLYRYLKSRQKGVLGTKSIKWNFTKFLVDTEGRVVKRFGPSAKPLTLESAIEKVLE